MAAEFFVLLLYRYRGHRSESGCRGLFLLCGRYRRGRVQLVLIERRYALDLCRFPPPDTELELGTAVHALGALLRVVISALSTKSDSITLPIVIEMDNPVDNDLPSD